MKNKYARRSRISGGQGPRAGSLLRRRSDGPAGSDTERFEPQHREPLLPRLARTHSARLRSAPPPVRGSSRSMKASSGRAGSRGGADAAPTARPSSSASSSARAKSIPRSFPTARSQPCRASSAAGWTPALSSTSDGWRGYNGLVDLGYGHFRVDHSRDEFTKGTVHINGIEGFWGLAKVRLAKFKGLPQHTFHLHLKETEWRYNHRHTDKYQTLLRYLRENPLS